MPLQGLSSSFSGDMKVFLRKQTAKSESSPKCMNSSHLSFTISILSSQTWRKSAAYSLKRYVISRFGPSTMSLSTEFDAVSSGRNLHIYRKQVLSPSMHIFRTFAHFSSPDPPLDSPILVRVLFSILGGRGGGTFPYFFTPWHFLLHCLFWPHNHMVPQLPTGSHAHAAPSTSDPDTAPSGLFSNPEDGGQHVPPKSRWISTKLHCVTY